MKLTRFLGVTIVASLMAMGLSQPASFAASKSPFNIRQYEKIEASGMTWSPDGQFLYFSYWENGNAYVAQQRITTRRFETVAEGANPRISPDGKKLLSSKYLPGREGEWNTYITDLVTQEVTADLAALTGLTFVIAGVWAKDGQHVFLNGTSAGACESYEIYSYDLISRELSQLTNGFGCTNYLTLDASGSRITAYSGSIQKGLSVDTSTGDFEVMAACEDGYPSYVPNSTRVVCTNVEGAVRVDVKNSDGSGSQMVANSGWPWAGEVSPDGKYLPFYQQIGGKGFLFLAALSGGFPKWGWDAFDGFSINAAALATNSRHVTLEMRPPHGSTEILVSNDGGFGDAEDYPVDTKSIDWQLVGNGPATSTRVVYVRFGEGETFTDSIILDTTAPQLNSISILESKVSGSSRTVTMKPVITERASGVVRVQFSSEGTARGIQTKKVNFEAAPTKQAHKITLAVQKSKKKLWVRFKDAAGNWSRWTSLKVK